MLFTLIKKALPALLILLALAVNASFAQTRLAGPATGMNRFIEKLLQRQAKRRGQSNSERTTVTAERLIASSQYDFNLHYTDDIMDSSYWVYSNQRSSTFNFDLMKYDNYYNISGLVGFDYPYFPDPNNQLGILSDTEWDWQINNYFGLSDFIAIQYDANNDIVNYLTYNYYPTAPSEFSEQYINTFDAYGNIITSLTLQWDSVWDSTEYCIFLYNGAHQLIKDSVNGYAGGGAWQPYQEYLYSYDGSGNIISVDYFVADTGGWSLGPGLYLTYNSDNTLKTDSSTGTYMGVPLPYEKDSFSYAPGLNYVTFMKNYYYAFFYSDTVMQYSITTKHISSAGLPDTVYQATYTGGSNKIQTGVKQAFVYDSYNNPITEPQYNFNIDSSTFLTGWYDSVPYDMIYYYYQPFTISQVKNISTAQENITVYPNPATDELNISRPDAAQNAYTFIKLINVTGQTIRTISLPWTQATEAISLTGLVPGMYCLVICDGNGNSIYRQLVIKK